MSKLPPKPPQPFKLSSTRIKDYEAQVAKYIDDLTDLQTRKLMRSVFAEQEERRDSNEISQDLANIKKLWVRKDTDPVLSKHEFATRLKKTMQVAFDYFANRGIEKDSLRANSQFANYMLQSFREGPGLSADVMRDFCDYLGQISLSPKEEQEVFLISFPPEAQYLACLEGTSERIEVLQRNLLSNEKHRPLLESNEEAISTFAKRLKGNMLPNIEVHVPHYLENSLGLTVRKAIHPQSRTPLGTSFGIHRDYAPFFRHLLKAKIIEEFTKHRKGIEELVNNIRDFYPQLNFDHRKFDAGLLFNPDGNPDSKQSTLIMFINNSLKDYKIDSRQDNLNFIAESDDGTYRLDEDLLLRAVAYHPVLDFIGEFVAKEGLATKGGGTHPSLMALQEGDDSVIFSEVGAQHILNLLRLEPNNHEEILVGMEALWMMGDHLAANCPIAFVQIVRELNKIEPDYLTKIIEPEIEKFFPTQLEKFRRIKERFDILNIDQNIAQAPDLAGFANIQASSSASAEDFLLGNLFYGNAPKEAILRRIDSASTASALISELDGSLEALVPQLSSQSSSEISPYSRACRQLMLRPDSREILEALSKKMDKEAKETGGNPPLLPTRFVKECLEVAAYNDQASDCKFLVNKFGTTTEIFQDSGFIHSIARHGNADLMTYFIKLFENMSPSELFRLQAKHEGNKPVIIAASYGNADVIRIMNDAGVVTDDDKEVVLHAASAYGKTDVVKLVSEFGSNLTAIDTGYFTAAHYAAQNGHGNVIRALAKEGVAPEGLNIRAQTHRNTPMELAIIHNNRDVAMALGDVGVRGQLLSSADVNKDSAIHFAAKKGRANFVGLLADLGADINKKNKWGDAAIHLAINDYREDVIMALIEAKADVNLPDKYGKTPLELLMVKDKKWVKILADAGANLNPENKKGETLAYQMLHGRKILYQDISDQAISYVSELIKAGLDINQPNKDGNNALHLAAIDGDVQAFRTLEYLKADVAQRNKGGESCLDLALQNGRSEIIQLFSLDAKINKYGDTLLTKAIKDNNINVAINLIDAGAQLIGDGATNCLNLAAYVGSERLMDKLLFEGKRINSCDTSGNTPLHYAVAGGQENMQKRILKLDNKAMNRRNKKGELPGEAQIEIKGTEKYQATSVSSVQKPVDIEDNRLDAASSSSACKLPEPSYNERALPKPPSSTVEMRSSGDKRVSRTSR